MVSRRKALQWLGGSAVAIHPAMRGGVAFAQTVNEAGIPIRALTKGPTFHWFGYYDKWQFDPTDRYILGNEVSFEGRTPQESDTIRVGMIDTHDGDRWIDLGETHAW